MNEIYFIWNDFQNFFIPTFKIKEKIRIGARIKKIYDTPKTPYERVIESKVLTKREEAELMEKKYDLDPFELKKELEEKLKVFFERVRKQDIRKVAWDA